VVAGRRAPTGGEEVGRRRKGEVEMGRNEERMRWGWGSGGVRELRYSVLRDVLNQAHLRSSIRASQLSQAERPFLHEVGIAEMNRASLPNNK
jgi:hypothetical protein